MLSKVADFYGDELGAMVNELITLLKPAMIVEVVVIVGSILLAKYLPMFTVFDQIHSAVWQRTGRRSSHSSSSAGS